MTMRNVYVIGTFHGYFSQEYYGSLKRAKSRLAEIAIELLKSYNNDLSKIVWSEDKGSFTIQDDLLGGDTYSAITVEEIL